MGYYNDRPKTNIERIRDAVEDIDNNGGGGSAGVTIIPCTWDEEWRIVSALIASDVLEACKNGIVIFEIHSDDYSHISSYPVVSYYRDADTGEYHFYGLTGGYDASLDLYDFGATTGNDYPKYPNN